MSRPARPAPILLLFVWAYSLIHFWQTGVRLALANFYGDFLSNFPSSVIAAWAYRPDFYAGSLAERWLPPPVWGFGPVFNVITLPLLWLPSLPAAYRVWLAANYAFLIATAWLLYRLLLAGRRDLVTATAFGFLFLNYYPLYEALIQRTVEIFELLLIAIAMTCYAKRRDGAAGAVIGAAAMTKFLPAIFVGQFWLARRWRAFWTALGVIVVLGVAGQLTLGWQNNFVIRLLLERDEAYMPSITNQALSGLVLRTAHAAGQDALAPLIAKLLIVVLLAAMSVWLLRIRRCGDWQLEWGLLCVAMVMLIPHNENYYSIFFLVPYAVLLARALQHQLRDRWSAPLAAASFLLIGWPIPLSVVDRVLEQSVAVILLNASVPVYGAALLAGALILELRAAASADELLDRGLPPRAAQASPAQSCRSSERY